MRLLLSAIDNSPEIKDIFSVIATEKLPLDISGVSHIHKAHILSILSQAINRQAVVICADDLAAKKMAADIEFFTQSPVSILPSRDFMFSRTSVSSREWEHKRIKTLAAFVSGKSAVMVTSISAMLSRTIPPNVLKKSLFTINIDDEISIKSVTSRLVDSGYSNCATTEAVGQFSVRGGILDVFSLMYDDPIRIEFFGDTIDTISFFDAQTQRRTSKISHVEILPTRETLAGIDGNTTSAICKRILTASEKCQKNGMSKLSETLRQDAEYFENSGGTAQTDYFMPFVYTDLSCGADYLGNSLVFLDDPAQMKEEAEAFSWRLNEDISMLIELGNLYGDTAKYNVEYPNFIHHLNKQNVITLSTFSTRSSGIEPNAVVQFSAKQLPSYGSNLDVVLSDIKYYIQCGFRIIVSCAGVHRAKNMLTILVENHINAILPDEPSVIPESGCVLVINGSLSAGFEYPSAKLAVITEGQVSSSKSKRKISSSGTSGHERVRNCADLCPGDIIVHDLHGIGRFLGIERMTAGGVQRDYIKIAFHGTDTLYIPATSLDIISKYVGGGQETTLKLNRLGGPEWKKQKEKARASAQDMARKLVALYAERLKLKGFAFPPDNDAQSAFEESFDYDETDDQLKSTAEIKQDMESSLPMDRLLCGDVGYGKTEVALRAVMKCIQAGKQAAILVPTTVLARQHYLTALTRFKSSPINVDYISRFKTPSGLRKTLSNVKKGLTDVLIGTHKLLQKDVVFKDLGLLVIDEEQRFGVSHKEAIKEITKNIDVLTLSATPIPRTLGMALSGIRDMSVLEQAPQGRQPVTTYVLEYSTTLILDAIKRELSRDGQVYYVHNRTESIYSVAAKLRSALPDANIAVGHGRMSEEELSDVMQKLSDGEIQVLVCTTIIETGIDVPNVNTLIIESAENFGLSQLHQLRGRVGRSARHAFAYFTYRPTKALTEISQKRLAAIREFAEFGAGFKIAMRDLEIRGAGNVLGAEQSGHIVDVGYDMYLRLLEDAVSEEKGEPVKRKPSECTVDFAISANLPQTFVSDEKERIDLYRRIALMQTDDDYSELLDEIIDRYGEPPKAVVALLDIALTRAIASDAGIDELVYKNASLIIKINGLNFKDASEICAMDKYKGKIMLSASNAPYLSLRIEKNADILSVAREFCEIYKQHKSINKVAVNKA